MEKPEILYEDNQILVCVKPAGFPVQTKHTGTMDLEHYLKNHLLHQSVKTASGSKKPPYLAIIHRLDQPVRGILVFAKTPAAAQKLNKQMQSDGFTKEYEALICGVLPAASGTLVDYLVKDGASNTSSICAKDTPGAKRAELSYKVLDTNIKQNLSVVQIHLKTGRHHQIRVQMAGAGVPLWGDNKYNPDFRSKKIYTPIGLCACHLTFTHPENGQTMSYKIPCNWTQFQ